MFVNNGKVSTYARNRIVSLKSSVMSGSSTDGFCFQKPFTLASHLMLCMKPQLTTNKEYIQNGYQMFDFRRISILHIYSLWTQEAKFFVLPSKHDNYILFVVRLASAHKWVPKITFRIQEMLASDVSYDIIRHRQTNGSIVRLTRAITYTRIHACMEKAITIVFRYYHLVSYK